MPRRPRVETPGLYHVGSRGNNKQVVFDDLIRPRFLMQLDVVATAFEWDVYAWALMSNHFHLVLEIDELGLAKGMQRLNLAFAQISNEQFGRINHCVGARYWSEPIEDDRHLHECIRYVLLNPVRAGIVEDALDSGWTSLRASVGLAPVPRALAQAKLLALFDNAPAAANPRPRAASRAGRPCPGCSRAASGPPACS